MIVEGPLIPAVFIDRPNRFITLIRVNEEIHSSHLPDPGRLKELLIPGVELLVRPESSPKRKTSFTTVMVRNEGMLISLVSTLPNRFVKHALEQKSIPFLKKYNLEFLGFTDSFNKKAYSSLYPNDLKCTSLENWNKFEINNPDILKQMYQFWVKK